MDGEKEVPPSTPTPRPRGKQHLEEVERRARTERQRWGRSQRPPVLRDERIAAAADLERIREGTEVLSPLAVAELALAKGLLEDAERRVLRPSRKKTPNVAPFEESLFEREWRARQEEEEQSRRRKEAADARPRIREDPRSAESLRPRSARARSPVLDERTDEEEEGKPPTGNRGRDPQSPSSTTRAVPATTTVEEGNRGHAVFEGLALAALAHEATNSSRTKTATSSVATLATEASTAPPPSVATLLGVEETSKPEPERRPERTPTTVLPPAASHVAATPSSVAALGTEEDDADPAVSPFEVEAATEAETVPAPSPAGEPTPPRPQQIVAVNHAATPFSMARLGAYLEDEADPLDLAFKSPTTAAATICNWSPHPRTPPAIVRTIASTLAALARAGHQEDDDYPVARRWMITTSSSNERAALVFKTSLGLEDEGGRASAFLPQEGCVAFRAGIG